MVPGDQADPKFENFESSTPIRSAFEKCSSKINSKPESLATSLKSSIFNACRLRWDQCDILSPVKSKSGLNSKRTNQNSRNEGHKWTNSIVLIGEFGPEFTTENAKSILSAQTLKIIRKHQINLIHVCEKSTPIFPSSVTTLKSDDYPTQVIKFYMYDSYCMSDTDVQDDAQSTIIDKLMAASFWKPIEIHFQILKLHFSASMIHSKLKCYF